MKKIPTLFERVFENHKKVGILPNVTPGMEWVLEGEGVATEKMDGSCCLTDNKRISMSEVQSLTQTSLDESRKTISNLTKDGLIELIGKEYMLTAKVYEAIKSDIEYTKDKVIQFVKAKNRILDYLEEEEAITNEKIRELCGFTKQQARAVIDKMRLEGILQLVGKGSASKYILASKE